MPVISLQAVSCLPPLEPHRGKLSVKTLNRTCYKPKGNSTCKWCNISASTDDLECPVNSWLSRAVKWCKLLNMKIMRVATNVATAIAPWEGRPIVEWV